MKFTFSVTHYAGLIMTLADATIDKLQLLGPPGLTHIVASSRFYVFRYPQFRSVPKVLSDRSQRHYRHADERNLMDHT
jgi:hypothetical protein